MTGTFINVAAILAGTVLGMGVIGPLARRHQTIIVQAVGLAVVLIGLRMALGAEQLVIIIISLAMGAVIGEELALEERLRQAGAWLEARFAREGGDFVNGFMTATLVYCVGAMAIMGPLQDGLTGEYDILLAKSALDGVTSIVFASTMGLGVAFSIIPLFIYQGSITLLAHSLEPLFSAAAITDMTATGGLLIVAIGLNLLGITALKVANLLPAILLAPVMVALVAGVVELM